MASLRDKRLKTDSPTPVANESLSSNNKSTSAAIKLKRMSRNRSGLLSTKSENEEGGETVETTEDTQVATPAPTADPPKTPNTRTKSKAREEEELESKEDGDVSDEKDSSKSLDTPRTRKLTKAQLMKKKGAELAKARLLKRKSLPPQPVKSSLRSSLGRRLSSGKGSVEVKAEEPKKVIKKLAKTDKKEDEIEQDEETDIAAVENESVTTAEPEIEADANESEPATDVKIKEEKSDKVSAAQAAIDLQNVRRSTRQRKSTIKERDNSFTRKSSQQRDKSEKRDSISPALTGLSIKTEKDSSKAISINVEPAENVEKDPSLSPELVSEEIDTESVQQLYDKPDFLENNLGIEQDPKLGEIVKEQEKSKVAEAIIKSDENTEVEETEQEENGIAETETAEVKSDEEKSEGSGEPIKENGAKINATKSEEIQVVKKEEIVSDPEELKQKETHLLSLGLLTHKAKIEAIAATQKRKEELAKTIPPQAGRKSKKDTDPTHPGSLIIKIKKRQREPIKMTIHKKSRDRDANGGNSSDFYTIQDREASSSSSSSSETHGATSRKSLNRSYNYNHDQVAPSNEQNVSSHEPVINKELEKSLVIPEKASSFKVHPERICKDQCFYCGGKFGLYDTPCHIAQIKTAERQKKILDGEEKLTADSCLCDACFRHVDRRANCPSYKEKTSKRLSAHSTLHSNGSSSSSHPPDDERRSFVVCNAIGCDNDAVHSLRRKWVVKMRRTISKIFNIDLESNPDAANVSICERHFTDLSHLMVCAMCRKQLPRNHIFYISQDIAKLENMLSRQGVNMKFATSTHVVCKLCSYYNSLLFKTPEDNSNKETFITNYSRKISRIQCTGNLTLTIRNGKIQPKNLHEFNTEVTITPAPSANSMLLDNDVCVGYDFPSGLESSSSPPIHMIRNPNYKGSNKGKRGRGDDNHEMARALKQNPNISMRELFPGEEEMNLNVSMPFNTSTAQRTADGWFKAQMAVQYDEVTKALWDRLQQPYGNSSSFLRHLILLEKYFRNGDLILSPSASTSASIYSESVRNRLKSYDNIPTSTSVSGATFSNEITITPAPKIKKLSDSLTITAQPIKRKNSDNSDSSSPKHKQSKIEEPAPKKSSPPELISFNQNQRSTRRSDKNESKVKDNEVSITATSAASKENLIILPSTLTPADRKTKAKNWKPTLLPISAEAKEIIANSPQYQTADGRKLPALVQVMSSGKPYHISIQDYNHLCLLRRERLMTMNKTKSTQQVEEKPNGSPNTTPISNNSALSIIPMPKEKESTSLLKPQTNSSKSPTNFNKNNKAVPNIPNLVLEQNSLIPINSNESNGKQRHHNGNSVSLLQPPPLLPAHDKNTMSLLNNMNISPMLAELTKTVNAAAHSNQLSIMKAILGDQEFRNDNIAALAQLANFNFGGAMLDPTLLSKIPKTLTVIPQAKSDRRASDEQMKQNSAST